MITNDLRLKYCLWTQVDKVASVVFIVAEKKAKFHLCRMRLEERRSGQRNTAYCRKVNIMILFCRLYRKEDLSVVSHCISGSGFIIWQSWCVCCFAQNIGELIYLGKWIYLLFPQNISGSGFIRQSVFICWFAQYNIGKLIYLGT